MIIWCRLRLSAPNKNLIGAASNLLAHRRKVVYELAPAMEKLGVVILYACTCELDDEWTPGNNTWASRKKILSNDIFQHLGVAIEMGKGERGFVVDRV